MARTAKNGLSEHPTKGFRLSLGKKPDGGYRTFWFGKDRTLAITSADLYRERFDVMKAEGRDVWTSEDEKIVKDCIDTFKRFRQNWRKPFTADLAAIAKEQEKLDRQKKLIEIQGAVQAEVLEGGPANPLAATEPEAIAIPTLYGAIEKYLAGLAGKNISGSHRWRAKQILDKTLKAIRTDCPLADIDYLWIDQLCDYWKGRPKGQKSGEAIKAETVVTTLRYIRTFFNWLDDSGFGNWEAPRKMQRPFRVRAADLMTPAELRQSTVIEQFDIPTLVMLYKTASDMQKTWMLTALFTGGTQMELSVLEKAEFDLDAGMLVHFRNKTSIEGRHWLCPELITLLRAEFKKHKKMPLAFYTELGSPLVVFANGNKMSDAVILAWKRLRKRAK